MAPCGSTFEVLEEMDAGSGKIYADKSQKSENGGQEPENRDNRVIEEGGNRFRGGRASQDPSGPGAQNMYRLFT